MLGVCNVLCNSIGHGAAAAFFHQASRKLRVMYAAKPPELLPRQVESFAMHLSRSGTTDEQSLVSFCVSHLVFFFPVNTVIVAAVAAICWEKCAFCSVFVLPSCYVSSFLSSPFLPPT